MHTQTKPRPGFGSKDNRPVDIMSVVSNDEVLWYRWDEAKGWVRTEAPA